MAEQLMSGLEVDIREVLPSLVTHMVQTNTSNTCLRDFCEKKKHHEKVKYMEEYFRETDAKFLINLKGRIYNEKTRPNGVTSGTYNDACSAFAKQNLYRALREFNKCICLSTHDPRILSMCYSNRSAVLFELKKYRESLEDIRKARQLNPEMPAVLKEKLETREFIIVEDKLQCPIESSQMGCGTNATFMVAYARENSTICRYLDVKQSNEMGRFVYVKRKLGPGNCLLIEQPFCAVLVYSQTFKRCAKCLKDVAFSIVPCMSCNKTIYCSEECQKEAWDIFHKFECPIIDTIFEYLSYDHYLAIRVVLIAMNIFESIESWMEFQRDTNNSNKTAFEFDCTKSKKDQFRAICNLRTNEDKREIKDRIYFSVLTLAVRWLLLERTPLKHIVKSKKQKIFFTDRLYEILMMVECNSTRLILSNLRNNQTDEEIYGAGLYPCRSLMSHSCAPNTMVAFRQDQLYLFVRRTILEGKPVTVNYDWTFHRLEKPARRAHLEVKYQFSCNCEACVKNYPQLQIARRRAYARAFL